MAESTDDLAFAILAATVHRLLGIDLEAYRSQQLDRRLQFFRTRHGLQDNADLAARLRDDPHLVQEFANFLTINVSEFFRNPDRFDLLRDRFLPELLRRQRSLRIWSAGCSVGAEIYSVALLLQELDPTGRHELLGTDIDAGALERARQGVFEPLEVRGVPAPWRDRYFRREGSVWVLNPEIRCRVRFTRHDLVRDPYPAGWDLILCRNVVIYFTEPVKRRVWMNLAASLRPGGILFIGGSESLYGVPGTGLRYVAPCFYVREEPASTPDHPAGGTGGA
ncbi:MCP methyltransferase, CheR-type [Thermaerobacter marianensis DSM 12885]|uniref:MCP methyltransferase, CheR-type n=1 Tax=Thermaerobacter marianensis (strain ATCC 700841 / DSM 12885 / JCM 10246 / 7p75a) TaxID=644966 RepID=E6SJU8_THEM7|nr:protein-glutamate O-methyltransferase CheR [Thermaerobacter marianensis]ADU52181.1 MCP methyltransferase, CheR-type [Thermaerobacter marianensis DSM 12885]